MRLTTACWTRSLASHFLPDVRHERHREAYCRTLLAAESGGAWSRWLRFFRTAVEQQAIAGADKARRIPAVYARREDWAARVTLPQHAVRALYSSDLCSEVHPDAHPAGPQGARNAAILWFPEGIEIAEAPPEFESAAA